MSQITEQDVLSYIESKYRPDIVLLGGSRAQGTSRAESDWDLYLVGEFPGKDHIPQIYRGQDLDIAVYPADSIVDGVLRIYYGPISVLKILKDNSERDGKRIADGTREAYEAGPEQLSPDQRQALIHKLSRLLDKTVPWVEDPPVAAFRLAEFYREVVPAWFALRGRWSLPIGAALAEIREQNRQFSDLLDKWARSGNVVQQLEIGRDLVAKLLNNDGT